MPMPLSCSDCLRKAKNGRPRAHPLREPRVMAREDKPNRKRHEAAVIRQYAK